MSAPVFLVPMRTEAAAVRFGTPSSKLVRIGMGPDRATAAAKDLAARISRDQPLVVVGLCGGLVPDLRCGDIVVASSVSKLDATDQIALDGARDVASALSSVGGRVKIAPIISSPKILHGDANRERASANGAIGVDMESYWCAEILREHPLVVVRVVFDVFGERFISPRVLKATAKAFGVISRTARLLANSFPLLSVSSSP